MTSSQTVTTNAAGWRTRFACEDPQAGLYLSSQTPLTVITPPKGDPTVLVEAATFMAIQKERDDFRRAVSLINAWRRTPGRSEDRLEALLASVGMDNGMADAVRSVLAEVQAMRQAQP